VLWLRHATFVVGVTGFLQDEQGRVLLLRHRFWPEGSWGMPSGYVNRGERFEDGLRRELREETGLDAEIRTLLQLNSGFQLRVEAVYAGQITGGDLQIDPGEILEARFFALDALPDGLLTNHRDIIVGARNA
jgi:8-oxo-dGTP diphosphatase